MKKRIMALVLAVLLCVGILPTAVFGEINEVVTQTDINDATVKVYTNFGDNTEYMMDDNPVEPSVSVYDKNGNYMYEGDDYSLQYANNTEVGTGKIILTGKEGGRLYGTRTVTFTIKKFNGNLAAPENTVYLFGGSANDTFTYTGSQIKPEVMVELDDKGTLWDSCYTVEYGPNVGPGQGWVKLTGTGEKAYGVPITGTRTVYFKIVESACEHLQVICVSDGDAGHHYQCIACGESTTEIQAHDVATRTEENDTHVFTIEYCQVACGWQKELSQVWKLNNLPFTGESSEPDHTYSRTEVENIGLEGLTEGEEYTSTITQKDEGGTKMWVKDFQPVEEKSVGSRTWSGKACEHVQVYLVNDGDAGHHYQCIACGESTTEIQAHVVSTRTEENDTHVFTIEYCQVACGWQKELSQVWKLNNLPFTGESSEPDHTYSRAEVEKIGLEGLTEDEEYTSTITQKDEGGTKMWVKDFQPVEEKSVGSRTWSGKACEHVQVYLVNDGDAGHHYQCLACGESTTEIQAHVVATRTEENDTHVFTIEYCQVACGWQKELSQMWKLDAAEITGVPKKAEHTGQPIEPDVTVKVGEQALVKGEDYTVRYENNTEIGTAKVVIESMENKSVGKKEQTFEIVAQCNHNWVWVTTHEQAHYQKCTECDKLTEPQNHTFVPEVVTEATCTANAVLQMKCGVCGRIDPNGRTAPQDGDPAEYFAHHVYTNKYDTFKWYHAPICDRCGEKGDEQSHTIINLNVTTLPTCLRDGYVEFDCSVCGGHFETHADENMIAHAPELAPYGALGHDFSGELKYYDVKECTAEGQGTHAPTCVRCGAKDVTQRSPHNWANWDYVQQGTCKEPKEDVIRTASCECGATLTLTYEREHTWTPDASNDVEPTCTESGKINGQRCTVCGTFTYDFAEALGHDWEILEKKDADCETEGFVKRKCKRCNEEETEILPRKSANGKHNWVPDIGLQPTCEGSGTVDGEICTICGAKRTDGAYGVGPLEPLGHKVMKTTHALGRTKEYVTDHGIIEVTSYETVFYCSRCYAGLGAEYYTVGSNPKISKYLIEPGKNVKIIDLSNGIHIDGNMAQDGGVYFNSEVQKAFNEVLDNAAEKYTYKKTKANSFIIEFTDEFLAELEDGEYPLEVINGDEYWPMIVAVKDHKFVEVKPMEETDEEIPEWTAEEMDAWKKQIIDEGGEVLELTVGCLYRQPTIRPENDGKPNENGELVITRFDGDYTFEALAVGEKALEAGKDYTLDGDIVTLTKDFAATLADGSEIAFRYLPLDAADAPAPETPVFTVE